MTRNVGSSAYKVIAEALNWSPPSRGANAIDAPQQFHELDFPAPATLRATGR